LSIQYWYAYLYNDFWNTHEMDWEMAQVVLSETATGPVPFVCGYSAHMGGHWQSWSRIEKAISEDQRDDGGTHPVVYVANGSHANYFRGPARFKTANPAVEMAAELAKPQRKLLDYTTSWPEGDRQMVTAELVPEPGAGGRWTGDWRWLNQEARFGSPGDFDLEFGDSGPKGPPQQEKKWKSPFEWLDEDCSVAPTPDAVDPPTALRPE
jgi:hypothetical protein